PTIIRNNNANLLKLIYARPLKKPNPGNFMHSRFHFFQHCRENLAQEQIWNHLLDQLSGILFWLYHLLPQHADL
ncbi:hypothetical protein, partial [Xanthomonas euvesicatoria]|uniref:hypothetical protein n=1 Tax=Xanthomonas euvesicatoria TaxID=456327 RepID=UPI003D2F0FC2